MAYLREEQITTIDFTALPEISNTNLTSKLLPLIVRTKTDNNNFAYRIMIASPKNNFFRSQYYIIISFILHFDSFHKLPQIIFG